MSRQKSRGGACTGRRGDVFPDAPLERIPYIKLDLGPCTATAVETESPRTNELTLGASPNPFNPQTTISYGLPNDSDVRIDIFNVLGQQVVTLVDEYQTAGYKSVVWDGSNVSSGVYFYTIQAGDHHASKKMLLIK